MTDTADPKAATRAIATRSTQLLFTIREEMALTTVADVFVKSGLFADAQSQSVAMVKILAGREMGMEPVQSMMELYVVHGRIGMYAEAMASKVKASGKYRYRVLEHTDEVCSIQFFERVDGEWEECGPSSIFTAADAKRAGTQNMGKFPRNMLWSRAMSNGFRWYCPDMKLAGMETPEENEMLGPPRGDGVSSGAAALEAALTQPPNRQAVVDAEFVEREGEPQGMDLASAIGLSPKAAPASDAGAPAASVAEPVAERQPGEDDGPPPASEASATSAGQQGGFMPPTSRPEILVGIAEMEATLVLKDGILRKTRRDNAGDEGLDNCDNQALAEYWTYLRGEVEKKRTRSGRK